MLRVWIVEIPPFFTGTWVVSSSSAITLLYPATLRSGAQSVTADRDTGRSDGTDKRKEVRQQGITEYQ